MYPSLVQCAVVATALKVLLFPAYKSTDFDVHRNWLAITYSLPIKEWYFENTSEWTLDYPPFFAWIEWVLSKLAVHVDPAMLEIKNLTYDSCQTIYFQRFTVIALEFLLVFALDRFIKAAALTDKRRAHVVALSILLSPGLLIIDHIHFQYNGALYGLLVLSLVLARQQSTLLWCGITFAVLLCFKHIYLYLALAYFVYLLRAYCLSPRSIFRLRIGNAIKLGSAVIGVFAAALGPFAYWGQLDQLKNRLFPFSRGLCHAYWAPNMWALYTSVDRILIQIAPQFGLEVDAGATQSVTRGLVGDTAFAVLPPVTKERTFILTLVFQLLPLTKLFFYPTHPNFLTAITLCAYASFLFGWHVHEKAVLLILIPFSLIATREDRHLAAFRPLAVAAHASLFPLLFTPAEAVVRLAYTAAWLLLFVVGSGHGGGAAFERVTPPTPSKQPIRRWNRAWWSSWSWWLFECGERLYEAGVVVVVAYAELGHRWLFGSGRLEFLPLMLVSTYTAVGVIASWLALLLVYLSG